MPHEKQTVAAGSMLASALMTVGKFTVGLLTGSLGLISEGLHSLLDFGATILTFLAVRISDKPADAEHPYGHGKAESIAALAETALLFLTSIWIVYEAVRRLLSDHVQVETTWWSVAVVVASIGIDISRARVLKRVAKKTRSQALEADALHFSSDVLSSAVVLIGLGFVALGWPKGDAVAAIGVSVFVCRAGWVLGRNTIDTLIDAAPSGVTERISAIAAAVPGVAAVDRVRVRPAGSAMFVDIETAVGRSLSQGVVAETKKSVVAAINLEIPEAQVTVTTHPLALDGETVQQRVMTIAANHNAGVHHITAHFSQDRLSVSFDLEIEEHRTIREAHDIASHLENDIRVEFGPQTEVETHIEPLQERGASGRDVDAAALADIRRRLAEMVEDTGSLYDAHDVRARQTAQGMIVIFHCLTSPDRTVAEVHETADRLERQIRQTFPNVWRIVAHTEPASDGAPPPKD